MVFNILKCTCGKKRYLPQRYIVAVMGVTAVLVAFGQRISLNIAITVMTNKTKSVSTSCPPRNSTFIPARGNISGGVIPWSNQEQNWVLGSFYPGYVIGHFPAGIWSDKYGARYILSTGMAFSTILSLLFPVVVINTPFYITMVLRTMMGFGQAVIFPAISCLYAKWVPADERSMLGSFTFAAVALGNIFGNLFTGWIIELIGTWHVGFYFWGLQGTVWYTIFMLYVYSDPTMSPIITEKEKNYLVDKIHSAKKRLKTPWIDFLKDSAVWALLICTIGHNFAIFTLVNNFPKYLSDVQRFDLAENTVMSSGPFLAQYICGILTGELTDYIIKKGASLVWCRKIETTIGSVVSATFLVVAGYMGCNGTLVVVMYGLSLLLRGPIYCGLRINHLDMSINFSGVLMAFINGVSSTTGFISPSIINIVAPNNTINQWRTMFWIIWAESFVTNLVFLLFASASRRKWDYTEEEMEDFYKAEEERKAKKERRKKGAKNQEGTST